MRTRSIQSHPFANVLERKEVSGIVLKEVFDSARSKVPQHAHEAAHFCIAVSGNCMERFGARTRECKPLSWGFFPAGETHCFEIDSTASRSFGIDIGPRWLDRARACSIVLDQSERSHGGTMAQTLMKLYREYHHMDEASPLAIEGHVLEMLAAMSRRQVKSKGRIPPRWLRQAEEFLRAHFDEHLSLVMLSEAVGVHAVHLAREFRKHYACTAGDYVRRLRVEYACREIGKARSSLAEIASTAGFSDQSHFSKVFRRHTGMTPAEYRAAISIR
ncbi:MAG TPA: AraC family transcriptional regulator [Blastocatellia bacterium]|nr:AraC family transcriptional regulator [Blastocatellia bacterium]